METEKIGGVAPCSGSMLWLQLFTAYLLNVADYVYTTLWVRLYGVDIEANPLGRWMYVTCMAGVFKVFVVGVLFCLLGLFIRQRPRMAWVVYLPLGVYGGLVVYHLVIFGIVAETI